MKTSDFYYDLPEELIAQTPLEKRDTSRLLVLEPSGEMNHRVFYDILAYLRAGDTLVINETKVIPARLLGKKDTGANVEVFLLKRLSLDTYECLVRPGKRLREGAKVFFGDMLSAEIIGVGEDGTRVVRFQTLCDTLEEAIDEVGNIPLPPYIKSGYNNIERYNTVYALNSGSAAAPTAGLHFTDDLLSAIEEKGVTIARVLLHVGLGTFRPVKAENIEDHHMHSEWYRISEESASIINNTTGRIICVGTTSLRAIESAAVRLEELEKEQEERAADGNRMNKAGWKDGSSCDVSRHRNYGLRACSGDTDIFIYPGYEFKLVDALITNFHLPESTLLMLVSALAGKDKVMNAYHEAVRENYRFFSFGDAMFVQKEREE